MQPHDPDHPATSPPLSESPSHSKYPDDVSTHFDPGTGRRTKRTVGMAAAFLVACCLLVIVVRYFHAHAVAKAGETAYSTPPPVDVVIARPATMGQDLVLPGETAAWYETTIYARVNGYVANWLVDIGDHVKKGQVLATIETPELDAELNAARAQLKASEAQVGARKAEAELSKSTYDRWRDSPKGVVSEQEREEKHADYDSAMARLESAKADVALDQARVDQYVALSRFKEVTAPFDGVISERRIDRLINPDKSEGLPAFLARKPGLQSGFMIPHVAAAALVNEARVLAHPASVDNITTSGSKEDHVSMGMTCALKLRSIVDLHNSKSSAAFSNTLYVLATKPKKRVRRISSDRCCRQKQWRRWGRCLLCRSKRLRVEARPHPRK